ncbi:FAD-dependent oxidoreductase [Candidatus Cetobacterium colombiensis]|uniref:FAD-dependent oxidoreductase n=1 Tax=Candidatus Cetobacterium colombiensis TaxID=3073100 RepID=A0ABU4W857_9FUSO|nr:FAD-dependent oxidoreductase [Candidatus Cetobacterium colombiensis]MDX8335697.1 FAD-dependent oxidoreductase [Candidatus Cetobacterium colombiensis]
MNSFKLKNGIYWIGALNPDLKVFDVIMETQFGTTYNSYLVKGKEKIAVFETVKENKFQEFLERLKTCLDDITKIDYIILNHTEPDHSGSVGKLLDLAPNAKVVGSKNTIEFLRGILNKDFPHIVVGQDDTLSLGDKTLRFISAPFLHWPDSMYTYIEEDKYLVTCDSFGSHFSFDGILLSKLPEERHKDYMVALRYYYMCIFSPFRKYVLEGVEKIKDLQLDMILPGHGPVLDIDIKKVIETYKKWSTVKNPNEFKSVIIPYATAYGYTRELAQEIEKGIKDYNSTIEVKSYDLNVDNFGKLEGEILREFQWADGILFGSCTINGDTLPVIWNLLTSLNPIVHGGKYVSAFGSYGWSGEAVPNILARLNQLRMHVIDGIKVHFRASRKDLDMAFEFGKDFAKNMSMRTMPEKVVDTVMDNLNPDRKLMVWTCSVCGESYVQIDPPDVCPACGVGREFFVPSPLDKKVETKNVEEKVVIIGGGIGALSVAQTIRQRNEKAQILMLSKEKEYPYYRTLLSEMIGEDISRDKFLVKPQEWYKEKNIDIHLETIVENINSNHKTVKLQNGEEISYDKLVIATGARAMVPSIGNSHLNGVFTVRNKEDVDAIKNYCIGKKKAVVIGGGVLGLESACGLQKLGLDVSVIEMMQRILPRQLDEEGSEMFEACIKNSNIKLYKNSKAEKFDGTDKVEGIHLDSGEIIKADIVIISSGIIPNKELAEKAGLEINRGIVVNEKMETSQKDIYACGDVAEYKGNVIGLWQISLDQGKIAGLNAVGIVENYEDKIQPVTFEGMGTKIFSAGGVIETQDSICEKDYDDLIYKKLNFKNNELMSGILIGDTEQGITIIKGLKEKEKKGNLLKKFYK